MGYARYSGFGSGGGGSGTVTSVGLADGSTAPIYNISNSPVTTIGTLTFTLANQTANKIFAGPSTGSAAQPTFRSIVAADLPAGNLTAAGTDGIVITSGTGAVIGAGTSIAQHVADATHNGYLLSTDWSTFNGKQAAGNYITALTGDVTASGPGSAAATLATVNSNVGSFGGATAVGAFTVNGKGLITAASSTAIQITESQVTNLTSDLAAKQDTVSIGNFNGTSTAKGLDITTAVVTLHAADGTNPGAVSTTTQTFAGAKTCSTSITSPAHISSTANPAASGVLRLSTTDAVAWRNNANSADKLLAKDTSDQLTYAGAAFLSSSSVLLAAAFPALTGDITTSAGSLATTAAATQANITTLSAAAGVAVHGTNTNNSAAAGFVGEYVEATTSGSGAPATGVWADATSISLTAGDWDVSFLSNFDRNGATWSRVRIGISTTSGNSATGLTQGVNLVLQSTLTDDSLSVSIPVYRMSLSSTTTVYAKWQVEYSAGNPNLYSRISARRVR